MKPPHLRRRHLSKSAPTKAKNNDPLTSLCTGFADVPSLPAWNVLKLRFLVSDRIPFTVLLRSRGGIWPTPPWILIKNKKFENNPCKTVDSNRVFHPKLGFSSQARHGVPPSQARHGTSQKWRLHKMNKTGLWWIQNWSNFVQIVRKSIWLLENQNFNFTFIANNVIFNFDSPTKLGTSQARHGTP